MILVASATLWSPFVLELESVLASSSIRAWLWYLCDGRLTRSLAEKSRYIAARHSYMSASKLAIYTWSYFIPRPSISTWERVIDHRRHV